MKGLRKVELKVLLFQPEKAPVSDTELSANGLQGDFKEGRPMTRHVR